MNPEISQPNHTPESSLNVSSGERFGGLSPEYQVNPENKETNVPESASRIAEVDITSIFPTPSIQAVPEPIATVVNDNPNVAANVDNIEKEWVAKARKIVSDTKDDPYVQGKEISKLQRDYIDKRFGRELGAVN